MMLMTWADRDYHAHERELMRWDRTTGGEQTRVFASCVAVPAMPIPILLNMRHAVAAIKVMKRDRFGDPPPCETDAQRSRPEVGVFRRVTALPVPAGVFPHATTVHAGRRYLVLARGLLRQFSHGRRPIGNELFFWL